MSIARAFQENDRPMPKLRGNVCCPIFQDEHIQWLVERFHVDVDITVESLHS